MQPQQPQNKAPIESPIPQPNAPDNPYEFILNPPQPSKNKSGFSGLKKLPIMIGASLGVLLILIMAVALLSGGKNTNSTGLFGLVAEQQEIIRVSDLALKSSKDPSTLALATTVKTSLVSDQNKTLELISSSGSELPKGQISSKLNKKTDDTITSAVQSNTLSQVYNDYLTASLGTYQKNLKIVYDSGGPKTKAFAQSAFNSSGLIIASL